MDKEAFLKIAKYPLVKFSDMSAEMRDEAIDISISAVEKFPKNMEKATQTIKENMDRKFGSPWNVICGEGFSYEISYEVKHVLYVFVGGTQAVLVWKVS